MDKEQLIAAVAALDSAIEIEEKADSAALRVPPAQLLDIAGKLKSDPDLQFDLLMVHTAVHWLEEDRFELLYLFYSTQLRHRLLLTCRLPASDPQVASLSGLWRIAEWQEREVYDLFGVLYSGHPDLRRLFLEDEWQGHPLRKDYKDDFMLEGP